jgi:aspartokinase/homoserine dehydrogenase 1
MKILKFGGTSVGSADTIKAVVEILLQNKKSKKDFAVVFSAMSGVTNSLVDAGKKASHTDDDYIQVVRSIENKHINTVKSLIDVRFQSKVIANIKLLINELEDLLHGVFLLKELSPRTNDLVLSFGERLSCYIISEYMKQSNISSELLDARSVIRTDNRFGSARVNFRSTDKNIKEHFKQSKGVQVITGFIASTDKNETTTLGRGGSDYTASIFGAALNVDEIEIWTDVD